MLSLLLMLFGVDTLMLLQILWTFESLGTDLAVVRFERGMYTDMRSDVVALGTADVAAFPLAGETKVVGRFTANMVVA
jgi:hypothetical protein